MNDECIEQAQVLRDKILLPREYFERTNRYGVLLGKANREWMPLPSFFLTRLLYARRRIVYTIFGLNVLLTYMQE